MLVLVAKVRYRGLMKNTARAFAMANLYLVRRFIVPDTDKCLQRRGVVVRLSQWMVSVTAHAEARPEETTRVRGTGRRR